MIVRELITVLKLNVDESKLKSFESHIAHAKEGMASLQELFVAGFAVGAFGAMVEKTAEGVEQMARAAAMLGTTSEALGPLKFMAEATGGSFDSVRRAIMMMNRQLGSAELKPNSPAAQALHGMNISMRELKSLTPDKQFTAIAEKLSEIPDAAQRTQKAFALFGRGAMGILPLIAEGKEGFEKLNNEFNKFGKLTEKDTQNIERFAKSQKVMQFGFQVLAKQLTAVVAPILEIVSKAFTNLIAWISKAPAPIKEVVGILGMLAAILPIVVVALGSMSAILPVLSSGFAMLMGPLLPWIAGLGLLFAIILDIYAYTTGGRSIFGHLVGINFSGLKEKIKAFFTEIGQIFDDLVSGHIKKSVDEIIAVLKNVANTIMGVKDTGDIPKGAKPLTGAQRNEMGEVMSFASLPMTSNQAYAFDKLKDFYVVVNVAGHLTTEVLPGFQSALDEAFHKLKAAH